MKIDGIEVCKPMAVLVDVLMKSGCSIAEKKVQDYHFHEVYIKMIGVCPAVDVDGVDGVGSNKFVCKCHWSTLEISEG